MKILPCGKTKAGASRGRSHALNAVHRPGAAALGDPSGLAAAAPPPPRPIRTAPVIAASRGRGGGGGGGGGHSDDKEVAVAVVWLDSALLGLERGQ